MATTVSQQISTPQPSSRLQNVAAHVNPSNNGAGAAKGGKNRGSGRNTCSPFGNGARLQYGTGAL